jgi:hypothetical protein
LPAPRPAAAPVPAVAHCSLERGHDGPHQDLGQLDADNEHWLTWDEEGLREIHRDSGCPARTPADAAEEDTEPCLLPSGHTGRHSFDLTGPPAFQNGWTVGHLRQAMSELHDDAPLYLAVVDRRAFDDIHAVITGATVGK